MSASSSKDTQNKQSARETESEAEQASRRAGKTDKSSQDAKSRIKAGKDEGAGGGAKQKQKH
jgi:hypothetical protein